MTNHPRGSRLALRFAISPLVIGLMVVAFGTSSPELAASVRSGLHGQADIALGNVVGSSVFTLLGILGIVALVTRGGLTVPPGIVHLDIPVMIAVAFACLPIFASGNRIARSEGDAAELVAPRADRREPRGARGARPRDRPNLAVSVHAAPRRANAKLDCARAVIDANSSSQLLATDERINAE